MNKYVLGTVSILFMKPRVTTTFKNEKGVKQSPGNAHVVLPSVFLYSTCPKLSVLQVPVVRHRTVLVTPSYKHMCKNIMKGQWAKLWSKYGQRKLQQLGEIRKFPASINRSRHQHTWCHVFRPKSSLTTTGQWACQSSSAARGEERWFWPEHVHWFQGTKERISDQF